MEDWYKTILEDFQELGEIKFREDVYNGFYQGFAWNILHPSKEVREYPNFKLIHEAFLNAYV